MPYKDRQKRKASQARYHKANAAKKNAYSKAYREANAETLKAQRVANADKKNAADKVYRAANAERIKAYNRANAAKRNECTKRWREANPEKSRASVKAWRKRNLDKARATDNKHQKKRRLEFNQFKQRVKSHYGCMNPNCTFGVIPPICLDFHHLSGKTYTISGPMRSLAIRVREINKCTVLCAHCHRLVTHGLLDDTEFKRCNLDEKGKPID